MQATSATSTDMTMSPSAPSGSRFGTKLGFVVSPVSTHVLPDLPAVLLAVRVSHYHLSLCGHLFMWDLTA